MANMSAAIPRSFLLRTVGSRLPAHTARQRSSRRTGDSAQRCVAHAAAAVASVRAITARRRFSSSATPLHSLPATHGATPPPANYYHLQQQVGEPGILHGAASQHHVNDTIDQQVETEFEADPTITTNELMTKVIHTIDQWPRHAFTQHLTKYLQHHQFAHSIEVLAILRTCDFYGNIDAALLTLRTALQQQQQLKLASADALVNEPIYGVVINLAAKCRRYDLAKELLFDAETHNHVTVNTVMWNMVLKAGIRQGAYLDVLQMFKRMQAKNYEPTIVTYNTILNACAKNHDWLTALDIFDQVLKDEARYHTAVERQQAANALTDSQPDSNDTIPPFVKPDLLTFNTVIHACSRKGKWQTAREIADKMAQYDLKPDRMTYNNLMQACIRGGVTKYAYQIFEGMQQQDNPELKPDLASNTLIMQGAVDRGEYQKVIDTFQAIEQSPGRSDREKVDMLLLNTVLTAYIRLCDFDGAFQLVSTMRQRYRLTPDTKLLTNLMRSSSERRQPEECVKLLHWCLQNVAYRVDWRMLDLALMSCNTVHHLEVFERLVKIVDTHLKQLNSTWTPAMFTTRITMYELAGNYQGIVDLCETFINGETAYGKQSAIIENLAITSKVARAGALSNDWSFVNRWLTYMQFIYRPQRALRLIHRKRNADKLAHVKTPKRHTLDPQGPFQKTVTIHIEDGEPDIPALIAADQSSVTVTTRNSKTAITVSQDEWHQAIRFCQQALLRLYNAAIDGYTQTRNHSAVALLIRRMDKTGLVSIAPNPETLLLVQRMLLHEDTAVLAKVNSDVQFLLYLVGNPDLSDPLVHAKILQQVVAYDNAGKSVINDTTRAADVQRSREQMSEWEKKQYGISDTSDEVGVRSVLDKLPEPPAPNPFAWPLNLFFTNRKSKQHASN